MNLLTQIIKTRLKLLLEPAFICLLLIFTLALAAVNLLWTEDTAKIRIGIMYSAEYADVAADFERYISADAEVERYTDEEALAGDVAAWRLECGYVLNADGTIVRYVSPQSMTADVADIMLTIAVMRTMGGEYGYDVVGELFPNMERDAIISDIAERTTARLDSGERMDIEFRIGGELGDSASAQDRRIPLFGIAAMFAFLIGLLFAMSMADERKSGIYRALKASGASLQHYMFCNMAAVFMAVSGFLLVSFAVIGSGAWAADIALCICYAAAVAAVSSCVALVLPRSVFPAVFAFSLIACMLFGGIAFDIGEIAAWMAPIEYAVITSYVMAAINGAVYYGIAALCGIAAVLTAICALRVYDIEKKMG